MRGRHRHYTQVQRNHIFCVYKMRKRKKFNSISIWIQSFNSFHLVCDTKIIRFKVYSFSQFTPTNNLIFESYITGTHTDWIFFFFFFSYIRKRERKSDVNLITKRIAFTISFICRNDQVLTFNKPKAIRVITSKIPNWNTYTSVEKRYRMEKNRVRIYF